MTSEKNVIRAQEARQRGPAELQSLLSAKKEEWRQAQLKHACKQLRQTHTLRQLRRDIARLQTVLAETGKAS